MTSVLPCLQKSVCKVCNEEKYKLMDFYKNSTNRCKDCLRKIRNPPDKIKTYGNKYDWGRFKLSRSRYSG